MFNKFKSVAKDAMWLSIGTVATVGYISYKAGKKIVDDVPEMMEFAQDTYSQVKDVLSKSTSMPDRPNPKDYKSYQEFEGAYKDAGYTVK